MRLPPYWGDDALSDFIGAAFNNTLATFVQKAEFRLLVTIDKNFVRIGENLAYPPDFIGAFLLLRSHAAFRGACRMATSGQVGETFPLLRLCLEYGLYALHIHSHAGFGEIWMRRHDDKEALKRCKASFRHGDVIATLKDRDANLYKTIDDLYERTIDFGAHPNERAISGSMRLKEENDRNTFQLIYLHGGDAISLEHALKTTAQIYVKELVLRNFAGASAEHLLERMIELSLYAEEKLKTG